MKTKITILFFSVLLLSCAKFKDTKTSGDQVNEVELTEGGMPMMSPSKVKFEKLQDNYAQKKRASIDKFCEKYWSNKNNNFSFLVAKDGQIIYERYQGVANRRTKEIMTKETPLHIASVSKVLTATAILMLVNVDKISLDQKVNTILTSFPYPEVTVRNLLSHRSGMRNYAYFTEDKGVWDRKTPLSNQNVLDLLSEKNIKLESPTNTRFSYCNTNYAILALIIEKITELSYIQAMQEMIFKPLGMTNTYVFDYDKDRKRAIPSYKASNMELAIDYLDKVYGDKNIYSTPRDLLKFDLARNDPSFLKPELRKEIYKGYSNERKGTKNYGLGIRMIEWETGQKFYFHNGWWHGNTSTYIPLINENVTIIGLSNKFTHNVYAARKLAPLFGDYPFKLEKGEKEE